MKVVLFLSIIFSLSSFANDNMGNLFNERMQERYPERQIREFIDLKVFEVPEKITILQEDSLDELLDFATAYDLFQLGWSYEIGPIVYQVVDTRGQVIGYNYSVNILYNDSVKTHRFYQVSRRVDGEFFVERIANYDF